MIPHRASHTKIHNCRCGWCRTIGWEFTRTTPTPSPITTTTRPMMVALRLFVLWFPVGLVVASTSTATSTTTNQYPPFRVDPLVAFQSSTRRRRIQPAQWLTHHRSRAVVGSSSSGPTTTKHRFGNRNRSPLALEAGQDDSSLSSSSSLEAPSDSEFDEMKDVGTRYFQGVTDKNATQIRSPVLEPRPPFEMSVHFHHHHHPCL